MQEDRWLSYTSPQRAQRTQYRISLPVSYEDHPLTTFPLVLSFHGWGGSLESAPELHAHGRGNGYIVVSPNGYDDGLGAGWGSWNGAGTTNFSGTCYKPPQSTFGDYCYPSCTECSGGCSWTTCEDSVAQVMALLREVQASERVDASRVFATGVSNGGVFVYELAARPEAAKYFAGFLPVVGAPHHGFNQGPALPVAPFLGLWGGVDTTIPPRANIEHAGHPGSADAALDTRWLESVGCGWLYTTARATTRRWAARAQCVTDPLPCDDECLGLAGVGNSDAYGNATRDCVVWRKCSGAASTEVIECIEVHGGHAVPPWYPAALGAFIRRHKLPAPPDVAISDFPLMVAAIAVSISFGIVLACVYQRRRGCCRKARRFVNLDAPDTLQVSATSAVSRSTLGACEMERKADTVEGRAPPDSMY
jgi:poly(3-hydroxybutyrate) depolymerase